MNLTVAVDDDILRRARIRATRENTSVNALVREYLTAYAEEDDRQRAEACKQILALFQACQSKRGSAAWSREDLYDR